MARRRHGPVPILRAGARGMVAAMAMSGVRAITRNLGLMEEPPPEKIVERHAPPPIRRLPAPRRAAVTEIAHWSYGAVGGAAFGLLPKAVRQHWLTGPLYGLGVWIAFEAAIAPVLGVEHEDRRVLGRIMLGLDHVLYGVVVAGRLAPEPEVAHG